MPSANSLNSLPAMISLSDVRYSVAEGGTTRLLLNDVAARITAGSIAAIVGPSGSGKSSILALMGALKTPQSGTVEINGATLAGLDEAARCKYRREQVGFIFQDIRLLPQLNAIDNVLYAAWLRYGNYMKAVDHANDALRAVGMHAKALSLPATMSGGEKQLVALARALSCQPSIILADEPTAALDWTAATRFLNLLRERTKTSDRAAVIVTHDPRVLDWVDDIYHLENGKLRHEAC